ncbi:hydrogenase maturation nickel metallochaperone HypA [Spirochaetota bacterium]
MHELSIMTNILEIVLEHAEKNNAGKVDKINLTIGELSDVIPQWAQEYFNMLSRDTIAENAELIIEKIPAVIKCSSCGHEFGLEKGSWEFACKKCNSTDIELLSGRELQISSIEVDQ